MTIIADSRNMLRLANQLEGVAKEANALYRTLPKVVAGFDEVGMSLSLPERIGSIGIVGRQIDDMLLHLDELMVPAGVAGHGEVLLVPEGLSGIRDAVAAVRTHMQGFKSTTDSVGGAAVGMTDASAFDALVAPMAAAFERTTYNGIFGALDNSAQTSVRLARELT